MPDPVATPYTPPNTPARPPPEQRSGSVTGELITTYAGSGPDGLPDWLVFGGGLLLTGGIATMLGEYNKRAGYMFAFLVVLGYAATGGRLENAVKFFQRVGIIAGG